MPCGEIQVVVMEKNNIFPREIKAYSELLFEVDKLLIAVNDDTKFAPKCFYTSFEPKNMLVFKDMKQKGYKALPRNFQLNFDLALPISKNPERQDFLVHYKNCARTLGLVAQKEWGNEWKEIAGKLLKFENTILDKSCDLYLRDEETFNVFNHNDLWIPNILFKFDDNKLVQDVLFVDYQLTYFGSPAIDLNFFIYGSLNEDTRTAFSKKLIRTYHQNLKETLVKLNYGKKIPTLHDIHVALLKCGLNGVLAAIAEVPVLLVEQSDDLDMDLMLGTSKKSEKFRYKMFNNPKYRNFIQKLLIEFDDLGYLD
jgi:hypothetical protein